MPTMQGRLERLEAEAWRRYLVAVAAWVGVDAGVLRTEWERTRVFRAEVGERAAWAALSADLRVPVNDLVPLLLEVHAAFEAGLPYESVVWEFGATPCRA